MKTIAVYNIKGGVGKTTTAVNIAYLSALEGKQTLLWDLDPQGAASFYFRIETSDNAHYANPFRKEYGFEPQIRGTNYDRLSLLPADFSYRHLDISLFAGKKPERTVHKTLRKFTDQYELVILDCAPSLSFLSENLFRTVDLLLVPTIPTVLSLRTLAQIVDYYKKNGIDTGNIAPFFSMMDKRRALHNVVVSAEQEKPVPFFSTLIPYNADIEKMGVSQSPICAALAHPMSRAYISLWLEISARLGICDKGSTRFWGLLKKGFSN